MAPAASEESQVKAENAGSEKILTELLEKLALAKTAEDTNQTTSSLATFINGSIEEKSAPTQ